MYLHYSGGSQLMSWEIPNDLYIYDCEVFKYDWLFVFKNKITGQKIRIHNDAEALLEFLYSNPLLAGYNNKFYDNYIIKGISIGLSTVELKELSDSIIKEEIHAWEHPYLAGQRTAKIRSFDIYDDMQPTSLKAFEGHRGRNIKETDVDFNIDRPLTDEELELEFTYCEFDVDATEDLFDLRRDYFNTKVELGEMKGIDPDIALSCTNAKIVAKYMGAVRQEWTDGRDYEFPKELDKSIIPKELLDFFNLTNDKSISDEDLFCREITIMIGGCPCTFKFGGAHGSLLQYHAKSNDEVVIRNRDVGSLYPSLIKFFNYLSRNVSDPEVFDETYKTRMLAKQGIGDIKKAKTFKLPLNTISGATDQVYSDLYDPHQARGMRYTGQLLIAELAINLSNNVPSFKLINLNTDGLAYEVKKCELDLIDKICEAWCKKTQFILEEDKIEEIWIKDVNNLIIKMENGKIKTVGSYVNYGVSNKGQWAINNNYIIVKKALIDYLTKEISVEETINNCSDILEFQLIAKVGSKFTRGFQLISNVEVPTQKVNRVYASVDKSLGTLYRVGGKRNSVNKISELPEHCIIDNENKLTIADIDKQWYIELAHKKINDYIGISNKKPKRKINKEEIMATKKVNPEVQEEEILKEDYSQLSVWQKVQIVREKLLHNVLKKSGVNDHMEYTYFELQDFLPILTPIMREVGITTTMNFDNGVASLTIYNATKIIDSAIGNMPEMMIFTAPMPPVSALTSNSGKKVVSDVQAVGMTMTYMRRYLYITAFDLIESDGIEEEVKKQAGKLEDQAKKVSNTGKVEEDLKTTTTTKTTPTTAVKTPKGKAPVNDVERKEIVEKLTKKENKTPVVEASLQESVDELKGILKKVLETNVADNRSFVQRIVLGTKKFTTITVEEAKAYIDEANKRLAEVK